MKADQSLEGARREGEAIEQEISRARLERDAFENRIKSCIEEHLALLEMRKNERGSKDNVLHLRRRSGSEVG